MPETNKEGEVGLNGDARHDDASMGVTVSEGLGHQHVAARQVPWGATTLAQTPMGHLHYTVTVVMILLAVFSFVINASNTIQLHC